MRQSANRNGMAAAMRSQQPLRLWHWLILMGFTCVLTFVSMLNYVTVRTAASICQQHELADFASLPGNQQGGRLRALPQPVSYRQVSTVETNDVVDEIPARQLPSLPAKEVVPLPEQHPMAGTGEAARQNALTVQQFEDLIRSYYPTPVPAPSSPSKWPAEPSIVPLKKRRIILTISTGHTGTMWLVRVLRCTRHPIVAEHEPKPSLVSFHKLLLWGREKSYKDRYDEKWNVFTNMLANATAQEGTIYAEISHMFIKSWADLFTDWLQKVDPKGEKFDVDIVVLRRYLPFVMRSFLTDKQTWNPNFNLRTWSGGEYTIHHRNFAILPPLLEHGMEDSVDILLGYLVDMELQYARFRGNNPRFRYIEYRAEDLFNADGARHLLELLGLLPATERCMAILTNAKPVNQHVSWKGPQMLNVSTDAFIARYQLYKMRYEAVGLPFPMMPQARKVVPCNQTNAIKVQHWCEEPELTFTVPELQQIVRDNPIPNNSPPSTEAKILAPFADKAATK